MPVSHVAQQDDNEIIQAKIISLQGTHFIVVAWCKTNWDVLSSWVQVQLAKEYPHREWSVQRKHFAAVFGKTLKLDVQRGCRLGLATDVPRKRAAYRWLRGVTMLPLQSIQEFHINLQTEGKALNALNAFDRMNLGLQDFMLPACAEAARGDSDNKLEVRRIDPGQTKGDVPEHGMHPCGGKGQKGVWATETLHTAINIPVSCHCLLVLAFNFDDVYVQQLRVIHGTHCMASFLYRCVGSILPAKMHRGSMSQTADAITSNSWPTCIATPHCLCAIVVITRSEVCWGLPVRRLPGTITASERDTIILQPCSKRMCTLFPHVPHNSHVTYRSLTARIRNTTPCAGFHVVAERYRRGGGYGQILQIRHLLGTYHRVGIHAALDKFSNANTDSIVFYNGTTWVMNDTDDVASWKFECLLHGDEDQKFWSLERDLTWQHNPGPTLPASKKRKRSASSMHPSAALRSSGTTRACLVRSLHTVHILC